MRSKNLGIIFGVLFFSVLSLAIISADSCSVTSLCSNSNNIVLKLSGDTNAHGELWSGTNYGRYLCCDFTSINPHTCTATNKLLKLSSTTNAHAEISSGTNYATDVCFGNLNCTSSSGNCPSGYNIPMLSLSSTTNAHLGNFTEYSTKICCKQLTTPLQPTAKWLDNNNQEISSAIVIPDISSVKMIIENTGLDSGTSVSFNIKEKDTIVNDEIITLSGTVGTEESVIVIWAVSQENIDAATELLESEPYTFYFESSPTPTITSPELSVTLSQLDNLNCSQDIIDCSSYSQEDCVSDPCGIAITSAEINPLITCGVQGCNDVQCSCVWNSETNICESRTQTVTATCEPLCGNGKQEIGEECDDGNLISGDGCSSECTAESRPANCTEGLTLCSDGTCSLICTITDTNNSNCNNNGNCESGEGCSCSDCNGLQDTCATNLVCNILGTACCNIISDGSCDYRDYCGQVDPDCTNTTTNPGAECGDGEINQASEECDDKNTISDDGNLISGDGCSSTCKFEQIYPGTNGCLEGTELCSNGNCSLNCYYFNETGEGCNDEGTCASGLTCSLEDTGCCNEVSDGGCNPYCTFIDPDCTGQEPGQPNAGFVIGNCTMSNVLNGDDCTDGFLNYSWGASWSWGPNNQGVTLNPDGDSYVNISNNWYYDPYTDGKRESEKCVSGVNIVPCPAQVQIPFFGIYNMLAAMILIAMIYVTMNFSKRKLNYRK